MSPLSRAVVDYSHKKVSNKRLHSWQSANGTVKEIGNEKQFSAHFLVLLRNSHVA
jgi:hypothetical protein